MGLLGGIAVYFIIWWLTLFLVLPYGVRSQAEAENVIPGTDPGAPVNSNLGKRFLVNTILSAVVFGAVYWAVDYWNIGFDTLADMLPKPGW